MLTCGCDEGKLIAGAPARTGGELQPVRGWETQHDCAYIKARNRLIPEGERMADAAVMLYPGDEKLWQRRLWAAWSAEFSKAMDQLWRSRSS